MLPSINPSLFLIWSARFMDLPRSDNCSSLVHDKQATTQNYHLRQCRRDYLGVRDWNLCYWFEWYWYCFEWYWVCLNHLNRLLLALIPYQKIKREEIIWRGILIQIHSPCIYFLDNGFAIYKEERICSYQFYTSWYKKIVQNNKM